MGATRAKFSPDFIAEVALAAIRGEMTINEIASQFDVYGNQVVRWKKQAVAELAEVFRTSGKNAMLPKKLSGKNSTARSDN